MGRFGVALAALGQRARVDRLDHAGRGAAARAERHALRVEQQRRRGGQGGEGGAGVVVAAHVDAVGREGGAQRGVDLGFADEQRRPLLADQHVGEEDRVVADVGTAQVEQPGDVVDGRDDVVGRAGVAHGAAHALEPAAARFGRFGTGVLVDRGAGRRGTVVPGVGEDVEIAAQVDAVAAELALEVAGGAEAEHVAVDRDRVACLQLPAEPVDVLGRERRGDPDEVDAAVGQLVLGLDPVAAVGEQRRVVERDGQRAHRAGEAGRPLAALPALGKVLREVRIARRDQRRGAMGVAQDVADAFDAKAGGRGSGVHGGF